MKILLFEDYEKTKSVYHIVSLFDLRNTLRKGIYYDDKITYDTKYDGFHELIEIEKTENIPPWLNRRNAIFTSLNYSDNHCFHANTVILSVKINPKRCWVANEDLANQIYAPFVLSTIDIFSKSNNYVKGKGRELLKKYWETSLSFEENLKVRRDKDEDFNEEVLVLHNIPPEDIKIKYIFSNHTMMTVEEFEKKYYSL